MGIIRSIKWTFVAGEECIKSNLTIRKTTKQKVTKSLLIICLILFCAIKSFAQFSADTRNMTIEGISDDRVLYFQGINDENGKHIGSYGTKPENGSVSFLGNGLPSSGFMDIIVGEVGYFYIRCPLFHFFLDLESFSWDKTGVTELIRVRNTFKIDDKSYKILNPTSLERIECVDGKFTFEIEEYGKVTVFTNTKRDPREGYGDFHNLKKGMFTNITLKEPDEYGSTPLMKASWMNCIQTSKFLIDYGVNLNFKNNKGKTALMIAADWDHKEIIELLINAGANISLKDNEGKTALDWADDENTNSLILSLRKKRTFSRITIFAIILVVVIVIIIFFIKRRNRAKWNHSINSTDSDCKKIDVENEINNSNIDESMDNSLEQDIPIQPTEIKQEENVNWHRTEKQNLTQIVLQAAPQQVVSPKFGHIMLGQRFRLLLDNTWAVSFFYLDNHKGPFLMVRSDEIAKMLKGSPVSVAFSFVRMPTGGLVALYVYVDCPEVAQKLAHKIVLFEITYGLDAQNADNMELLEKAFALDELRICFTEGDGPGRDDGYSYTSSGLRSFFDVVIPISAECREMLNKEYKSLLDYHSQIPSYKRDYQQSLQQLWADNPQGKNPILK